MNPTSAGQEAGPVQLIVNTAKLVSTNEIVVLSRFLPGIGKNV